MRLGELLVATRSVRALVRDALGCGCPESVFADIRIGLPILYGTHRSPNGFELLVGQRLLVACVPFSDLREPQVEVPAILAAGRQVRDELRLNRFRLLVVGVDDAVTRQELDAAAGPLEDRMHLHLLDEAALMQCFPARRSD